MNWIFLLPKEQIDRYREILVKEVKDIFLPGEMIGVKVHFGEPGNRYALSPNFLIETVTTLKSLGVKPFLFDSPVMYKSRRNSVEGYKKYLNEKGITDELMGCPVIISDEGITARTERMEYSICRDLVDADGVLVLSHVKGHTCTGFGGAIKNIGMGGMSKETKKRIHRGAEPVYKGGCQECGECIKNCPLGNIGLENGRPYFDRNWCCGCSTCVYVCEHGCIDPKMEVFDVSLVSGVKLALERYKKVFYVNSLMNITRLCDCVADPGPRLAEDIGILFGNDIVAIEKASLDLVIKKMGHDVFKDEHHKSPLVHIMEAEAQEMGSTSYELVMGNP